MKILLIDPILSLKHLSGSVQTTIVPSVSLLNTRSATGSTFLARWLAQLIKDALKKEEHDQELITKAISAFASAAFYAALNSEHFTYLKSTWLDCNSKAVLLSKPSLDKAYFTKLNNTLSHFDSEEVEEMFLSNCKKALLREPEIAALAISQFFKQYTNPTDSFAVSFLQMVNTSIVSTNDDIRKNIIDATGAVACNISDATVLTKFIEQLFDFFKANSTKLPQRTSIATAILYACKNVKTVENSESVISKFAAALPSEANDSIVRLIWTAFSEWIVKGSEMPASCLPILRKGVFSQGDTKSISLRISAIIFDKFANVAVDPEILKVANAVCKAAKIEPIVSVDFIPAAALVLRSNALNGEKIDSDLYSTLSTMDTINREKIYSTYANEGIEENSDLKLEA